MPPQQGLSLEVDATGINGSSPVDGAPVSLADVIEAQTNGTGSVPVEQPSMETGRIGPDQACSVGSSALRVCRVECAAFPGAKESQAGRRLVCDPDPETWQPRKEDDLPGYFASGNCRFE